MITTIVGVVLVLGVAAAVVFGVLPNFIPGFLGDSSSSSSSSSGSGGGGGGGGGDNIPISVDGAIGANTSFTGAQLLADSNRKAAMEAVIAEAVSTSQSRRALRPRALQTAVTVSAADVTIRDATGGGGSTLLRVFFTVTVRAQNDADLPVQQVQQGIIRAVTDGTEPLATKLAADPTLGSSMLETTVSLEQSPMARASPQPNEPSPSPSSAPTPSGTPSNSATPSPSASATPSPSVSASPSPSISASPSRAPSSSPSSSATPTPTATPTPSPSTPAAHVTVLPSALASDMAAYGNSVVMSATVDGTKGLYILDSADDALTRIDTSNSNSGTAITWSFSGMMQGAGVVYMRDGSDAPSAARVRRFRDDGSGSTPRYKLDERSHIPISTEPYLGTTRV